MKQCSTVPDTQFFPLGIRDSSSNSQCPVWVDNGKWTDNLQRNKWIFFNYLIRIYISNLGQFLRNIVVKLTIQ